MSMEELDRRVAAVEHDLEAIKARLTAREAAVEDEAETVSTMYIRQTGECPPKGWQPGDPIPEPDWWN